MDGPGSGSVAEVEDPTLGPYDALVQMQVCGVCSSTDRMLRRGTFAGVTFPSILGHESVGRLVEIGPKVRTLKLGGLVTRPSAYAPERAPINMHWGGMAEYGVVTDWHSWQQDNPGQRPASRFDQVHFPDTADPELLSLSISLSETYSVACRENLLGKTVVVVGTGIAGLSFMRYAKLLGAAHVIGVGRRAKRLELARQFGADDTALSTDVDDCRRIKEAGIDVCFEASGAAEMIEPAYGWLKRGGRMVIYSASDASTINLWASPRDAALVVASTNEAAVLPQVYKMVECGLLHADLLITHRYPFRDAARAFADIDAHRDTVKALLTFGHRSGVASSFEEET
jgi:L-iditol 2-dehydrogenase